MNAPAATWIDEIAVERALKHQRVGRRLTHAERLEVTRQLIDRGKTTTKIARYLHVNGTTARLLCQEATQ